MFQKVLSSWLCKIDVRKEKRDVAGAALTLASCLLSLFTSTLGIYAQEPNWIETETYNVDGTGNNITSRVYGDGMGRSLQTQTTVNAKDSVIVSGGPEYDAAGRPVKTPLPFAYQKTGADLGFISGNLITGAKCANEYYNGTQGRPNAGGYAYSETRYYDDPLGRIKTTGAAGADFSINAHPARTWNFGVSGTGSNSDAANYFDDNGFIKPDYLINDGIFNALENTIPQYLSDNCPSEGYAYYLTVVMDVNGSFSQQINDIAGKTRRSWSWSSSANQDTIVSHFLYDIQGNLIEEAPPKTTGKEIDPSLYTYNSMGQILQKTTPDGGTVTCTYDGYGRLEKVMDANYEEESPQSRKYVKYTYDDFGRTVTTAQYCPAAGISVTRLRTVYDFPDSARQFLAQTTFESEDADAIIAGLTNTMGRVVAAISYDQSFEPATNDVSNEYDYSKKTVDLFSYDNFGRVVKRYKSIPGLPLQTSKFGYDVHGKMLADTLVFRDKTSGNQVSTITCFFYGENGRLGHITRNKGDDQKLKTFVNYSYDILGKPIAKIFEGGPSYPVNIRYNIRGWVNEISTEDNVFREALTANKSATEGPFNGNLSRATITTAIPGVSNPGATLDLNYTYDHVGRLTSVKNGDAVTNDDEYDASFAYLKDGRILRKNDDIDQKTSGDYTYYTGTNRLQYIENSPSKSGTASHPNFIYDFNGNMVLDRSKKMAVEYDWSNMPVRFVFFDAIPENTATWDDVKSLFTDSRVKVVAEQAMVYDASGTRVLKEAISPRNTPPAPEDNPSALRIEDLSNNSAYEITTAGSLVTSSQIKESMDMSANPPADGAFMTGTLDADKIALAETQADITGKLIGNNLEPGTDGDFLAQAIDHAAQSPQAVVTDQNGTIMMYGYLPGQEVISGVAYGQGSSVFEKPTNSDPYALSYVNVGGEGISRADGSYNFFVKDHLGSTRVVLDQNMQPVEATAYLAFGAKKEMMTSPTTTRERFTGKEYDMEGPKFARLDVEVNLDFELQHTDPNNPNRMEIYFADAQNDPIKAAIMAFDINVDNSHGKIKKTVYYPKEKTISSVQFILNDGQVQSTVNNIDEKVEQGKMRKISLSSTSIDDFTPTPLKSFLAYSAPAAYDASGVQVYYFGKRYYDPEVGVWISVDPKKQFFNAYAYAGGETNPIIFVDENGEWLGYVLGAIAGAYIGGAMSNSFEFNPGKWDWDNSRTYMGMVQGGISGAMIGNSIEMSMVGSSGNLNVTDERVIGSSKTLYQDGNTRYVNTGSRFAGDLEQQAGQKLSSHVDEIENSAWHRFLGHDKLEYKIGISIKGDYQIIAGTSGSVGTPVDWASKYDIMMHSHPIGAGIGLGVSTPSLPDLDNVTSWKSYGYFGKHALYVPDTRTFWGYTQIVNGNSITDQIWMLKNVLQ